MLPVGVISKYCKGTIQLKHVKYYSSTFGCLFKDRELYQDVFPFDSKDEVPHLIKIAPQTVYAGFDPTAESLHVGNLLIVVNLLHWQKMGHKPIALIGGATAQIGDPSGKSHDRPAVIKSDIDKNINEIKKKLTQIFHNYEECFGSEKEESQKTYPVRIMNNLEWFEDMKVLNFVGNIGRNFRVGYMLNKQSVRERMKREHGISFTEFTYQILQAYDWLHLLHKYKCKFQIGGSDQLGNIISGYDLIKNVKKQEVYGLTIPLIVNEEGDKYGKSAGNAIWLSKEKTSPFTFYQHFVRTEDADVEKLLKIFTFHSIPKIDEIMKEQVKQPEKLIAQKILAESVTKLVHGKCGLEEAELTSSILFGKNLEALKTLESSTLESILKGCNIVEIMIRPGFTSIEVAMEAGCFKSIDDATRIISGGGFYINFERISNLQEVICKPCHILPNNISLLRVGKRQYTMIKWLE